MSMITGSCPQCNQAITPGKTQTQFNRNLGLHLRWRHGVKSKLHADRNAAQPRALKAERQRRYRAKRKAQASQEPAPVAGNGTSLAQPIALNYCPCCGARFYAAKGQ